METKPSTSAIDERCNVCNSLPASTHFGVNSCRSCAAFFRRACVLKKVYKCRHGGKCNIEEDGRASCAACRFKKCQEVGMEANKIRPHYDKNGARTLANLNQSLPPLSKPLLPQMLQGYQRFIEDAKTLYYAFHPENAFTEEIVFQKATINEHSFFDRIYITYYMRMLNKYFWPFQDLSVEEKKSILDIFHIQFAVLNKNYLSSVYFLDDENKQFLQFGGYTDIFSMDHFFSHVKNSTEVKKTFSHVSYKFRRVAKKFRNVKLDETEMVGLIGITLWQEASNQFPTKGHDKILERVIGELADYCKTKSHSEPTRIARILCLLRGIEELFWILTEGRTIGAIISDMPAWNNDVFQK